MSGRQKKKNGRCNSRKVADVECDYADASPKATQSPGFDKPVGITITCYRIESCDTDGLCEKFVIDGLVNAGLLQDDTAEEVAWVRKNAVIKIGSADEEKTVIEIEEVA